MRRSGPFGKGSAVEANEIKAQCGNPAFLEKVYDGIRLEARITGTEAPQQQILDATLQIHTLDDRKARLRRALGQVIDGTPKP